MELMEEVLNQGKQVILLIPEIALTYQTVQRFYRRFEIESLFYIPGFLPVSVPISLNGQKKGTAGDDQTAIWHCLPRFRISG